MSVPAGPGLHGARGRGRVGLLELSARPVGESGGGASAAGSDASVSESCGVVAE